MSLLKKSTLVLSLVSLSLPLMAQQTRDLGDLLQKFPLQTLTDAEKNLIKNLSSRYPVPKDRPQSCPMESKNYNDIRAKIESIRGLFKDTDCLDDPTVLDQITAQAESVQAGLSTAATTAGMSVSTVDQLGSQVPVQVNGQQVGALLGNLNNLLFKNKCSLKKGTVLERGADVIQNFAQIGLLVPNSNGLIISGGGLALATLMRMVDNLLKKDFDFDSNSDRQNFIKLNCAFYDLRHQIELSGMLDVATDEHKSDLARIEIQMKELKAKLESNAKNMDALSKAIAEDRSEFMKKNLGEMLKFAQNLSVAKESLSQSLAENASRPAAVEQRQMILTVTKLRKDLITGLDTYMERGLGLIALFDLDFKNALLKFDPVEQKDEFSSMVTLSTTDFDQKVRANLLFHVERISSDLTDLEAKLEAQWTKETRVKGLEAKKYIEEAQKKLADSSGEVKKGHALLESFKERLSRVIESDSGFTMNDDGTENKTTILSSFDEITEQIYGKWGYEFLQYTTKRATEGLNEFNSSYKIFGQHHLDNGQVPQVDSRTELQRIFACQDVRPVRMRFSLADSLAQQGHDFVSTNKDLFHAEIPRVFLGSTGNRAGIHKIRSKFEVIQEQYKSTYVASKLLNHEDIDPSLKEKYLGRRAQRKNYLGIVMLEVEKRKHDAQILQELNESFNCHQLKNSSHL
ncbi:MAG: hypothetical protein COW00_10215 [Bdellovibrio sp. CG12_big_fil_rev_8_21_14_0_65_39_13]|nr:MAG: hypothetical protein COW78_01100 [Bdellovibrio sp. CG22_combo_CG10-13_8_21_14_all_39_27]PIQ59485.1 MAG: hypothetical protein COW00_10215 [Bdellovibrio sp. CG12_big_fil_rev_8_21_14_0_65_39_13]PIR33511.1 MAG: hypothetical protein COV37_16270 [Bdellovibrio sp. CG11_big_fil_rev_8_21_14_0_20_39_38]